MIKKIGTILIALFFIIFIFLLYTINFTDKDKPYVFTESTLEEIVTISDLSTYQAIHNSYCTVFNEENPDEIDYHVAYDAIVDLGIDFSAIDFEINDETKTIKVELPEIKISNIEVDINSLDFLFVNDDSNIETLSAQAYNACIADVSQKVNNNDELYELARKNAENVIIALIEPLVEQLPTLYKIEI